MRLSSIHPQTHHEALPAPTASPIRHNQFKMSVRVVARIRPLLKSELEKDQIVTSHAATDDAPTIVKIPNPKNFAEEYSFQFNSVYEQGSTQQELFEAEGTNCRIILGPQLTVGISRTHHQTSLPWLRCHNLRVRLDWYRKDTHNAWWKITGGSWYDSTNAQQYIQKE